MATRPRIKKFPVIIDGDMSQATITSNTTIIEDITMISYSVSWSGTTPVGTLCVQVSNDYALNIDGSVANAGTWTPVPLVIAGLPVTQIPISGNTGNGFIDIDLISAYAIQLLYTKASGTGLLQAIVNAKVS